MPRFLTTLAAAALVATAAFAGKPEPVQQHNSNAVWFENWVGLTNATMVVAAPNGRIDRVFAEAGTPVYQLNPDDVQDGVYRFELRAATDERVEIVNPVDNGRGEDQSTSRAVPFYMTGHFVVQRGVIITPELVREGE